MRRLKACHPPAFLVDQNGRIRTANSLTEICDEAGCCFWSCYVASE
jgi:hypothetical protein